MRWIHASPTDAEEVAAALAAQDARLLSLKPGRRRHLLIRGPSGARYFVKHVVGRNARHPLRDRSKRVLGIDATAREWRALRRLAPLGVRVPDPVALGALPDGGRVLVTRALEGRSFVDSLDDSHRARVARLERAGHLVGSLHALGFAHDDLHAANLLVCAGGLYLTDPGRMRRTRSRRAFDRDLGALEESLARHCSAADRVRLRRAALSARSHGRAPSKTDLRSVARAASRRARARARSRTRRALRPGRRFAPIRVGSLLGLRLRTIDSAEIEAALAAHRIADRPGGAHTLKRTRRARVTRVDAARPLVVKEFPARGAARALRDAVFGSAARRAWRGGHGLQARRIGAATPLAFLERRRFGCPIASLVVLEALPPGASADRAGAESAEDAVRAVGRLATMLHTAGATHRDLKASHAFLVPGPRGVEARLVDLEDVRFPRRLGEAARIRALAQLNASLPDAIPDAPRRRAFERYARALPFRAGADRALARIVTRSLARKHHWSGGACARPRIQAAITTQRK